MELLEKLPPVAQGGGIGLVVFALLQFYKIWCDSRQQIATREDLREDHNTEFLRGEIARISKERDDEKVKREECERALGECRVSLAEERAENKHLREGKANP